MFDFVEEFGSEYMLAILLWPICFAVLLRQAWWGRRPVTGLMLMHWANLSFLHLLAGVLNLLPWHHPPHQAQTIRGFGLTAYAMAGFLIGHVVAARLTPARPLPRSARVPDLALRGTLWACVGIGISLYLIISGMLMFLPSSMAILGNGLFLTTACLCLLWYILDRSGRKQEAWTLAISTAVTLPLVTMIGKGFLGHGAGAAVTMSLFIAVYYRPRYVVVVGAVVALFVGLTLTSAYLASRSVIRSSVWGGREFGERMSAAAEALQEHWNWFDLSDPLQLKFIEMRLNQNIYVGLARNRIESGQVAFADGETISDALLAMIPRAVWRDKPSYAGSGNLVSRFAGIYVPIGTSFGIGNVMEMYVNYGEVGVLVGFIILGGILTWLDLASGQYLYLGNYRGFLLLFMIGQIIVLSAGNVLAEVPPAVIGLLILWWGLCQVFDRLGPRKSVRPPQRPARPVPHPLAGPTASPLH